MKDEIFEEFDGFAHDGALVEFVMDKCNDWRDHYSSNFADKHEEYYRLFRNQWSSEDKTRESERSRLIAPALSQAVESNVAEIEEATFGRGKIFDIRDNVGDKETGDVAFMRDKLHEAFELARIRSSVSEVLINAAVFGTGIGEIVLDEMRVLKPATRPVMDGALQQVGVEESYRPIVKLNPVQPKNFLIDPAATCVEEAMGCAVDEYVSRHAVEILQEEGVYRQVFVGDAAADSEIEPDAKLDVKPSGRVRLTKYYGLVPRELLIAEGNDEEDLPAGHYVESVVVIANEGVLLKAIPNPYMTQCRPVVAFQWDVVPSVFWGRGVCEKGYMSQKALDAELRARIDALALTTHPMLAVDATRIPRGHKMEVRPGRMLLTNGAPSEAIMPFNFGQLNGVTFQQGAALQSMVSQATGAADGSVQMQQGETAAGMSMSQGAIVKRQKRTLLNFQENFLIPLVQKAAHRYMQFDPDNFPVKDYDFIAFSSLGAMAREYEVAQLSQILQVVKPDSPAHSVLVKGIIDHLNVSNREELIAAIDAGNQPNPQEQKLQQQRMQLEAGVAQGQINLLNAQAQESQGRARKYGVEAQLAPTELSLKYSDQDKDGKVDVDFEKKIRMAELLLKEQEMEIKRQASAQPNQRDQAEAELMRSLQGGAQGPMGGDEGGI